MPDRDPRNSSATGYKRPASSTRPVPPAISPLESADDPSTVVTRPPTPATGGSGTRRGQAGTSIRTTTNAASSGSDTPVPLLPLPGDRLDGFLLEASIGAGGMGAVFRALDGQLDRTVALKVLPPEQSRDSESVGRFYQEGRAAARLDHENIARVHTIGHSDPYHYIAFEYIEGSTIRQRVERGGILSVRDAMDYTLQISSALIHAAERGVVHRDVKPSNIILTPRGRAKLVDMGLARSFERGGDAGLTQTGMTLGTFDYISPEQARDPRDVDVRSDLYSLGCTLYYMLAGRPPFPDGTVLQKLLQHQEEPPPDVRAANPSVPAAVAAIVLKLMAKDRERRYQTPEALARDLWLAAASADIRPLGGEGSAWAVASATLVATPTVPRWERYLAWGGPSLAFALVVGLLAWVNGPNRNQTSANPGALAGSNRPSWTGSGSDPTPSPPSGAANRVAAIPVAPTATEPAPGPARPPRNVPDRIVRTGDDLARLIAESPPNATLLLLDEEYTLRAGATPTVPRGLAIRAGIGVRPVIRPAHDPLGSRSAAPILDLRGGQITLDGLEFEVNPEDSQAPLAAIRSEGTELTLTRCSFRVAGTKILRAKSSWLTVREGSDAAAWRRSAWVLIEACHFDPGETLIATDGPVDVVVRDATFGGAQVAAILATNADPERQAAIRVEHASFVLGAGPLLRSSGLPPQFQLVDSVVDPPDITNDTATLVVADEPGRLDWQGRNNLYGRIDVYLRADRASTSGFPPVRKFDQWSEGARVPREVGSVPSNVRVWAESDPASSVLGAAEGENLTRAFRLLGRRGSPGRYGVRKGPMGSLADPVEEEVVASNNPARADEPFDRPGSGDLAGSAASPEETAPPNAALRPSFLDTSPLTPRVRSGPTSEATPYPSDDKPSRTAPSFVAPPPRGPDDEGATDRADPYGLEGAPGPGYGVRPESPGTFPIARASAGSRGPEGAIHADAAPAGFGLGATSPTPPPAANAPPHGVSVPQVGAGLAAWVSSTVGPDLAYRLGGGRAIRSPEALAAAMGFDGGRGTTLLLPAGADWEMPPCTLRGTGSWTIRGEAGTRRPRIRFHPTPGDGRVSDAWTAWLFLASGRLRVEGIDIVLPAIDAPRRGGWAAFAVAAGTDLTLKDCTVTIEGNTARSAAVVAPSLPDRLGLDDAFGDEARRDAPPAQSTRIRLENSFLRVGGDVVDVAAGRKVALEVDNALVSASGRLLHAHGQARGRVAEPLTTEIRRLSARTEAGLIELEGTPADPELPMVDVVARDSVLATDGKGAPLLRLDGQDDPDELRDRIRWDGIGVAYHGISRYRRDQAIGSQEPPSSLDRAAWEREFGRKDRTTIHGDVRLFSEWPAGRAPWVARRGDLELRPEGPASRNGVGPDLGQIPEPPDPARS